MPTTMTLISKQTVGVGGSAGVTFSNIPQTFTDLKVVMSTRSSGTSGLQIRFNGSTSNRSNIRLYGNGNGTTASFSGSEVFNYMNRSSFTANTFDSSEMYIPNYTSSNFKSVSIDNATETNAAAIDMQLQAGLWSQTAAITSLGFFPDGSQTLVQNSEFSLYGISNNTTTQNISGPSAFGGDTITTDGSFWYHTFLSSGVFLPFKNLTCDYLVVAGGGSGGSGTTVDRRGGGGGAGGYRTSVGAGQGSPLSLTAQAYVVTVGAGATALTVTRHPGTNGNNSVSATITSTGGGFGSTPDIGPGNGGSGGGGGDGSGVGQQGPGLGNTPSTSPSQGNNGGAGQATNGAGAGTGGGATAAGITSTASAGGAGATNSISGTSVTYSTGGAVINGGSGINANANTGNGGSSAPTPGGGGLNGGSGIVIVRYKI
jgi:hypothetical protein